MSEWRPLETLKPDGTHVLLGYQQQGDEMPTGLFVGVGALYPSNKLWIMNSEDNEKALPSHWQPLPRAPTSEDVT